MSCFLPLSFCKRRRPVSDGYGAPSAPHGTISGRRAGSRSARAFQVRLTSVIFGRAPPLPSNLYFFVEDEEQPRRGGNFTLIFNFFSSGMTGRVYSLFEEK
jgi:hypothetical protein